MPNRTSPRHSSFDYRTPAAYFVTVCAHERRCLFGSVKRGRMVLNPLGRIVVDEWCRSEALRDEVILDGFVVMPNHMHGIVCLVPPEADDVSPRGYDLNGGPNLLQVEKSPSEDTLHDDVGTHRHASLRDPSNRPRWEEGRPRRLAKSLGSMMAGFKGAVTTRINQRRGTPGAPVWQSRFYDRILRNEREWRACRGYIEQNPAHWMRDRNHPARARR